MCRYVDGDSSLMKTEILYLYYALTRHSIHLLRVIEPKKAINSAPFSQAPPFSLQRPDARSGLTLGVFTDANSRNLIRLERPCYLVEVLLLLTPEAKLDSSDS